LITNKINVFENFLIKMKPFKFFTVNISSKTTNKITHSKTKTMKTTVKITKTQLVQMLLNWNFGAQPASIQYVTSPKLTKEGKIKFGEVTKIANVGCMVGYNYENSVNNQLEREEKEREFMAQSLWNGKGKRLSTALSTHTEKGTFYLTYKAQQTFKSFHFDQSLNPIPNNEIKKYFPDSTPKNQGVERGHEVYHREISIDNVKRLKVKKITYVIEG
jgi:hypothetical protein